MNLSTPRCFLTRQKDKIHQRLQRIVDLVRAIVAAIRPVAASFLGLNQQAFNAFAILDIAGDL
jgi:hypothetical protein